jgi:alpha-beta hydrolase superfamily lysophospholipase
MRSITTLFASLIVGAQLLLGSTAYASVTRLDSCPAGIDSKTFSYEWVDDSNSSPKAAVILVHGLTQQGLSFDSLARTLAAQNYLVVAMDQRGHGRWHSKDSIKSITDFKQSGEDLQRLCHSVRAENPHLPIFCLGESCGAAVVAQTFARHPDLVDGIILASPGARPRVYHATWLMHDIAKGAVKLNRPIDVERYIARYASNDPRITKEMLGDPLARKQLSAREVIRSIALISRTPGAARHIRKDMPVLILQGAQDRVLAAKTVQTLYRRLKTDDKDLLLLPDAGHVIIGTAYIKPEVVEGISTWLDAQLPTQVSDAAQLSRLNRDDLIVDHVQPIMVP